MVYVEVKLYRRLQCEGFPKPIIQVMQVINADALVQLPHCLR